MRQTVILLNFEGVPSIKRWIEYSTDLVLEITIHQVNEQKSSANNIWQFTELKHMYNRLRKLSIF